jgi:O-antigen/teichoic acid export membrane protein
MGIARTVTNLLASVVALGTNFVVNLVLAPFLVASLGPEAFGFVGLINSLVGAASVITVSLNLMAGRYVAIALHQNRLAEARVFFNSALVANVALSVGYVIACIPVVVNVDRLFSVSTGLKADVQIAFIAVTANLIVTSLASILGAGTLARNRLDMGAVRDIISQVMRVAVIGFLFWAFPPRVLFIGVGALAGGLVVAVYNVWLARKLLPDIRLEFRQVRIRAAGTLLVAGASYVVNGLSGFLMNDASLLVVNITLGGTSMGLLALARTIPVSILLLASVTASVFGPDLVRLYASGDLEVMIARAKFSLKVVAFIVSVPSAGLLAFGLAFFRLWLPALSGDDVRRVYILASIISVSVAADAFTSPFFQIFMATARTWVPTSVAVAFGATNIVGIVVLLKVTNWDLFGVTIVGSTLTVVRVMFLPIYGARILHSSWWAFLPQLGREGISFGVLLGMLMAVSNVWSTKSWGSLIIGCAVSGILGYALNYRLLLSGSDRAAVVRLLGVARAKLKRE